MPDFEALIPQRAKDRVASVISRRRRFFPVDVSVRLARRWVYLAENRNYDPSLNGEAEVIRRAIGGSARPVVFDVGANVGDWTELVLGASSAATVHSFELVPATAERLAGRFGGDPRVNVVASGLGDAAGPVRVKHYPSRDVLSGLTDFPHSQPHTWIDARVTTGLAYCEEHEIDHIDLLKIDVEGTDLRVIHGFGAMVDGHQIDAIQFEYGPHAIYTHDLLRDFDEYLGARGYSLGKIFPGFVWFRPYDLALEDLIGPNYLAVPNERLERWQ